MAASSISDRLKNFFQKIWLMVRTPYFLKHFVGVLAFLGAVIGLLFFWLDSYTLHGKSIQVPDFADMELVDAKAVAKASDVILIVSDSTFRSDKLPGVVLTQNPKKGAGVKKGRKIYLSITKFTPDEINMPKLFGVSENYKQYSKKLARLGIKTKISKEIFRQRLSSGTILKVFYKGKDISSQIEKGFKVPVGSTVGFIVSRSNSEYVPVPNLKCKSLDEATFLLESSNLTVGKLKKLPGVTSSNGYIVVQSPYAGKTIHTGDAVDLTVATKKAAGCN